MPSLPLAGIRVLDMTVVWAGPYCCTLLADMGAEVIRLESLRAFITSTRGTLARPSEEWIKSMPVSHAGTPGRVPGARPWNRTPLFNAHGRNKLGMTLDVRDPEGMDTFKSLVRVSDVFIENNVSETMDKLGISYELLREQRPDIIMLRRPAYGNTGPYRNYRAHGVHIEGVLGHTMLRSYPDMDPSYNSTVLMSDAAGGTQGAFAVIAALHHRNRTGKGQLIELAQAENAMPFLGEYFMDYSMNGRVSNTLGNRHPHALQGCYPCKGDDHWVNITIYDDRQWAGFCHALGNPAWTRDEKYGGSTDRYLHHDELDEYIAAWTRHRDSYEVMHLLQAEGVPAGPVINERDAYNDPQMESRGMFQEAYQEDCGTHLYPGPPYQMSETPLKIRRGPVRLGEDNGYVYKELLGVSDQDYGDLEGKGQIGMDYAPEVP